MATARSTTAAISAGRSTDAVVAAKSVLACMAGVDQFLGRVGTQWEVTHVITGSFPDYGRLRQRVTATPKALVVTVELVGITVVVVVVLAVLVQMLVRVERLVGVMRSANPVRNGMGCLVHGRSRLARALCCVEILEQVKFQLLARGTVLVLGLTCIGSEKYYAGAQYTH